MDKRLSLDETLKYLKLWKESRDENALLVLINGHSGLIALFANRYLKNGLNFDDLYSAGKEGLIIAIERFNYDEYEMQTFSTYASSYIEGYIKRDIRNIISIDMY